MKISKPFTLRLLNTRELHPLQAASNQSGERLVEMETQTTYETPKRAAKVVANTLILPDKDSPTFQHLPESLKIKKTSTPQQIRNARNALWLTVSWCEKRANAQFAREFELPLPPELDLESIKQTIETFALNSLVSQGMVVDMAIHETYAQVPLSDMPTVATRTAYLLCTTRPFFNENFINKPRVWNAFESLRNWRRDWFDALSLILPPITQANLSQATIDLIHFCDRFGSNTIPTKAPVDTLLTDAPISNPMSIEPPSEPARNLRRL